MATLRDIRRRIKSVKKTSQITKAMQMVAAARLRRMQEHLGNARPYADRMTEVIAGISSGIDTSRYPLLEEREEPRRLQVVVVSTDRGLCGGLNTNLFRKVEQFLKERRQQYRDIEFYLIGQKARDYFKRRDIPIKASKTHVLTGRAQFDTVVPIAKELMDSFLAGQVDEVGIFFNWFHSVLVQRVNYQTLLPIQPEDTGSRGAGESVEYIYEPTRDEILARLFPRFIEVKLYRIFLEAQTSEFAARMRAMDSATSNALEMIDRLTLSYNRARQAAITKELMDIVNGAEALRYQ